MSSSNSATLATAQAAAPAPPARRGRVLRGLAAPAAPLSVIDARVVASVVPDGPGLQREAERGYAEGFDRGYADGLSEGRSAMAAEVDAARSRLASAARSLTAAAGELARRQTAEVHQLEDVVAGLAYEIAAAIVGRELATSVTAPADALARALALAPPTVVAVARFHPDDVAVMEVAIPLDRPVTVVADPTIEPGGCVVEAGDCRVDAQISAALDRVRSVLLGDRSLPSL